MDLESLEAANQSLQSDLKLAFKRIGDLQAAIEDEMESDDNEELINRWAQGGCVCVRGQKGGPPPARPRWGRSACALAKITSPFLSTLRKRGKGWVGNALLYPASGFQSWLAQTSVGGNQSKA